MQQWKNWRHRKLVLYTACSPGSRPVKITDLFCKNGFFSVSLVISFFTTTSPETFELIERVQTTRMEVWLGVVT